MLIVESLRMGMGASSMQIYRDSKMPGTEVAHLKCTKVSESQLMETSADNEDHKMLHFELCDSILSYTSTVRKLQPQSQ